MRQGFALSAGFTILVLLGAGAALSADNPAMNVPDEVAWRLFMAVATDAGNGNALFETWANDNDTFNANPRFPTAKVPLQLHAPIVPTVGREEAMKAGHLMPQIPVPGSEEETRRNKAAFDFIVSHGLYKVSGLRAAFGQTISFPVDAVEVKANWTPVSNLPVLTLNRVSVADAAKYFHVNTNSNGEKYALTAVHVISKLVPNWTWATFENRFNRARCDIIGCHDNFGAAIADVKPNPTPDRGYDDCAKTPALQALVAQAHWDPAFSNYCLKGSQTDFTDSTGLAVRVGNSITEDGFVDHSSCMTCHGRAGWSRDGRATSNAGFENGVAPLGPINPAWFWMFSSQPPIYQGMLGLTQTGTSADFVWSVPFCAIDDTGAAPKPSRCRGK